MCLLTLCSSNSYVHLPDNTFFFFFPFPLCFPPLQNNIAEVKELHSELMWKDFIDHISKLLHSVEVEVSYFAAGIIAHLISRGEQAWTLSRSQRTSLLEQLVLKSQCSLSCSSIFVCLYLILTVLCSVLCSILPFWTGRPQSVRWWLTGNNCLDLDFGKYSRTELNLKLVPEAEWAASQMWFCPAEKCLSAQTCKHYTACWFSLCDQRRIGTPVKDKRNIVLSEFLLKMFASMSKRLKHKD